MGLAGAFEGETAGEYLRRNGVNTQAIENFWTPFCISALNTPLEKADAALMRTTLKKSVLRGGNSGILYIPQKNSKDLRDYPVNKLRNIAIVNIVTTHFLVLDMDMWPARECSVA